MTDGEPASPPARRAATQAEARALASPVRLRIIRELFDGPLTNSELAARLGRDKATVLHHVRTLVDTGFLEALAPRPGPRGSRERPYRSTGKSWRLSAGPDGEVADAMVDAFVEEVAAAQALAPPDHTRIALRLTPQQYEEFTRRLAEVVEDFADRAPSPDGIAYAAFLSVYRRAGAANPPAR